MGYQALYGGSGYALGNTAYDNIAIGYKSMFGTTGIASTGYRNIAIGNSALQTNTSGDQNTAV